MPPPNGSTFTPNAASNSRCSKAAADSAAFDRSDLKSEADLIRDYQAGALAEADRRGDDLLKYVKGRLDELEADRSGAWTGIRADLNAAIKQRKQEQQQ